MTPGKGLRIAIAIGALFAAGVAKVRADSRDEPDIIQVKFRMGTAIGCPECLLPPELKDSVASLAPLFTLADEEMERVGATGLRLWFSLTLRPGTNGDRVLEELKRLDSVEVAERAPRPAPPP